MSVDPNLEPLRRSLVMMPADQTAGALSNADAARLVEQAIRLAKLQDGIADLLQDHSPVPRANAQLRRACSSLASLLASSRAQSGGDLSH
jgi:hypothetical protein